MKNKIIIFLIGLLVGLFWSLCQKDKIVYVPKKEIQIEYKIVDNIIEKEKIVYKKRSCKVSDTAKEKMCMDYFTQKSLENEIDEEPSNEQIIGDDSKKTLKPIEKLTYLNHRFNFHISYGKVGKKTEFKNNALKVNDEMGIKGNVQYQYKLNEKYNISTMIDSVGDAYIGFGVDL